MILGTVFPFLDHSQGKHENQKFFKYKALSCFIEFFFCLWKMDSFHCSSSIQKVISADQLFRKKFPDSFHLLQCLSDRFFYCIIGQSCRQGINGLHCISFFLVRGTGIENLRMLHHQCVLFAHNPSAQSDHAAPPQCVAKKRHPKPDHFQSAGHVFQIECGDLHFFILTDLDPPEDRADDSDCLSLLDLSNGNRIFIDIIGPRIIRKQVPNGMDTCFYK